MSTRVLGHLRHNAVAYLALFFALSGSAFGAAAVIKTGDPAGGDLSGTYPNPSIAAGSVTGGTGGKVADNTLTGADILESTLGQVPSAADADTLGGNAPSAFLPVGGKAADSDKLDGNDSTAFVQGSNASLSSYRRDWAVTANPHRIHTLPNVGTLDLVCGTGPSGSLTFTNTTGDAVDSFVEIVDNGTVSYAQTTTLSGGTSTQSLGSTPKRVVWQFTPSTWFASPYVATVTMSHYTGFTNCRVTSQAITQDPVRGS
jgi:hypothetical protein